MLADLILRVVVERALVSAVVLQDVRSALEAENGSVLAEELLERLYGGGYLSREAVVRALGEAFAMDTLAADELDPHPEAISLIPPELAREAEMIPIRWSGGSLVVAVADPVNFGPADHLAHLIGRPVEPVLADAGAIRTAISRHWSCAQPEKAPREVDASGPLGKVEAKLPLENGDGPVGRYVAHLIEEAVSQGASDIHLEPMERRFRIRLRVDGRLRTIEDPPRALQLPVISRLKLMAGMSIDEKRLPQDGRIRHRLGTAGIDLRASSLPGIHGESMVLRILDAASIRRDLGELGFFPDDEARFRQWISRPNGMVLVTGPTGSGKTTTLYAVLRHLNVPGQKLITVEDPVEYQVPGINQVPVRRKAGLDFARALRAILRQSPNVIMIGEIRDRETAEIAIHASFTGHLVLSTLHTNDAAGAVSRLVDIGVAPFLVAAALRGVLAQRLVRRRCPGCSGWGCRECGDQGFRGRVALHELLEVGPEIRHLIHRQAPVADIRDRARSLGMRTLREDGERKVQAKVTTLEEVLAATMSDAL